MEGSLKGDRNMDRNLFRRNHQIKAARLSCLLWEDDVDFCKENFIHDIEEKHKIIYIFIYNLYITYI